ncbi:aminodeoxychorismate synthase component I [Glaesserella sp.]|uniref:aminodeoxychorismate synthase component I n=1 Tax=Glaesserella sp. TaxID=2094731 RepID=UPI0035A088FE
MQHFIQTANQLGCERQPFFFLIDFEQQKPLILPISETLNQGITFDLLGYHNTTTLETIEKPFEFQLTPLDFNRYKKGFELVKAEIQAGNSYLLNLSYPTPIKSNYNLEEIYIASRAKYKLLLDNQFVCFSPECFIRIKNNTIYSYPMKGTINAAEDNAEKKLFDSEKEFTEHNTIVDLIRNDLSLVAERIEVSKYRYIEKLETHRGAIYQTSSEIRGRLKENWQAEIGTILAKLLPAGSISGAPKAKTVAIIQQTEQQKRGYYTGVFGYFDGKKLESAVAIRYIEQQGNQFIFRSGGGITALSQLQDEYNEILEKVYVPISLI